MTNVVVVTGLSGSGKTLALRCLEDMGYYAVDNLPVALVGALVDLLERGGEREPRGAFVIDVRERAFLEALPHTLAELRDRPSVQLTVLFFDAGDETLLRRFSESRRPHPLAQDEKVPVAENVARERQLLAPLRALADRVMYTDAMSPGDLRHQIRQALPGADDQSHLHCQIVSFGFKHGLPRDADIVLDARFLQNPFFKPDLRSLDGRDEPVTRFLEEQPEYQEFLKKTEGLLAFLMPRFIAEGKSYLTVAIGCTGGRHRSVAIAERLGRFLTQSGYSASITHRDLTNEADKKL